jgi:alanine racemase
MIGQQGPEEVTVNELADTLGTINYEIVAHLAARVPRIAVGARTPVDIQGVSHDAC